MNVPFTKNIVFNDSIPLWAAINKALSTIIPPWASFSERAYIGLWHGVDYMMQAAVAVCVLRSLGKRTFLHVIVTSIVFLCVPAFIFRYAHASLSAQYLLLAGLALYLRTTPGKAPRVAWFATFCALLFAAAMINPYHVAMDFVFLLVALLRTKNVRAIVTGAVLGLLSVGIGAATAGFFVSEAKVAMTGFELASANLLAPFVPRRSVMFGDLFGLGKIDPTEYQYEGYSYLGLGILVLLVAFVILGRRVLSGTIRRHPFLFVVVVGASLFALSNHVWFAGH